MQAADAQLPALGSSTSEEILALLSRSNSTALAPGAATAAGAGAGPAGARPAVAAVTAAAAKPPGPPAGRLIFGQGYGLQPLHAAHSYTKQAAHSATLWISQRAILRQASQTHHGLNLGAGGLGSSRFTLFGRDVANGGAGAAAATGAAPTAGPDKSKVRLRREREDVTRKEVAQGAIQPGQAQTTICHVHRNALLPKTTS